MLEVRLVTPQDTFPPLEAEHVTLPTHDGEWGIRTGHMSFVCLLVDGVLMIRCDDGEHRYRIGRGVAHIDRDVLEIFTEGATEER